MSRRLERVSKSIHQEVALILQNDVSDPRVGLVSVTHVDVSADLRTARVYVSALGSDDETRAALKALRGAAGHIQAELARRLSMKYVPVVSFEFDRGLQNAMRIAEILDDLEHEREEKNGEPGE